MRNNDTVSAEGLRAALLETAERAHKTGCRPIEGLAREFFNWDWWQCRNDECNRARAALRSSESDSGIDVERLAEALDMPGVFDAPLDDAVGLARDIAREYDALSTPRTETSE